MKKSVPIAVGQLWRNKKTPDKTVRVTQVTPYYGSMTVRWETVEGKGQRTGVRWEENWNRGYTLVEEASADV